MLYVELDPAERELFRRQVTEHEEHIEQDDTYSSTGHLQDAACLIAE